jgi:exopolysaccharide biosynthesis protein
MLSKLRKIAAITLVFSFFAAPISAEVAQTMAIQAVDLKANAPEGTFLEDGAEPIISENSYQDENISINITRYRDEESKSNATVADIRVSSFEYLRRAFSSGKWRGRTQKVKTLGPESGAILAMTGDYASLFSSGLVVANGEVYRKTGNKERDVCLILMDGRMETFKRGEVDVYSVLNGSVWHSFLFGPALLDKGEAVMSFASKIRSANPRSVLGYYEPGHYCFVVVDGRSQASSGMTLKQLSRFMKELGCVAAYNLDGGQSALMWFNGAIITTPYKGGRPLTDILCIVPEAERP